MCAQSQLKVMSFSEIMKKYGVYRFATGLQQLMALHDTLHLKSYTADIELDDNLSLMLVKALNSLGESCAEMDCDSSLVLTITRLSKRLEVKTGDRRSSVLIPQLEAIREGIEDNLVRRQFFLLSSEEAEFHMNPLIFGNSFGTKYPVSAMKDVIDAGGCYASSHYTACVFHCMRVAEYGLRKLAQNNFLKVRLTNKGKRQPIEYAEWQKVIEAIRSKIVKIRQRPIGPKRDADLRFLATVADQCEYMKDIWRNEVSHTRRWYKKEEALAVINRVKEFVTVVGEHRGSIPAEDSIVKLMEMEAREEAESVQLKPLLPGLKPAPKVLGI